MMYPGFRKTTASDKGITEAKSIQAGAAIMAAATYCEYLPGRNGRLVSMCHRTQAIADKMSLDNAGIRDLYKADMLHTDMLPTMDQRSGVPIDPRINDM